MQRAREMAGDTDALAVAYASFSAWCEDTSRAVVAVSNPGLNYNARPNGAWPLMRLEHAIIALVFYMLLLVVGLAKRALEGPSAAKAAAKAKAAAGSGEVPSKKAKEEAKEEERGLFTRLNAEPMLFVVALYNASQVALSTYMAIAAVYYAVQHGYAVACNPFDPQERDITFVEWVFYASKVRASAELVTGSEGGELACARVHASVCLVGLDESRVSFPCMQ